MPEPNPPTHISYRDLMDHRFRRSGDHVYLPMCENCQACQPIRLAISKFSPREDQRRCRARNRDLTVSAVARGTDAERHGLYQRYQTQVHGQDPGSEPNAFLVADGGIPGGELHARDGTGRLVAVSVIDVIGDALSSVYCYYDPAERRRGLGTFMALAEIEHAKKCGLTWLYLGFYVAGCQKMMYKARFAPAEILADGAWQPFRPVHHAD